MRLKQDKNGQIVQTNPAFNGEEGVSIIPELVEEGNLFELTEVEDPKKIKERQKAQAMGQLNELNKVISYNQKISAEREKDKRNKLLGEQKFMAMQKMHEVQNYRNNNLKSQALSQGNMMTESLSGVSGYGLTADGRQPVLSQAAVDFQPIVTTEKAFGSYDRGEQWGTQMGATDYRQGISVGPSPEIPEATAPVEGNLPGNYTTLHQYLIDSWKNNSFVVKYYKAGDLINSWSKVMDANNKRTINTLNENFNGIGAVITASQRGWMWSGWYKPSGVWVSVKVPYVYGLPMDSPDNPNVKSRDTWRKYIFTSYEVRNPKSATSIGSSKLGGYFNAILPIIEAFAVYYKYVEGKKELETRKIEYETLNAGTQAGQAAGFISSQAAQGAVVDAMTNSIEKLLAQLKAGEITRQQFMVLGGFQHPFAKYKVLK